MLKPLLMAAVLFWSQQQEPMTKPPDADDSGIIAGAVIGPNSQTVTQPVQVVLLSTTYNNLLNSDVQKRLDVYWERYKSAFAQKKEFFFEISRMAHRDAIQFVMNRMKRDARSDSSEFIQQTSSEGKFEFKNVPFGEYRIVALATVGQQDLIWQESVEIKTPIPQFLELKNRLP